MMNENTVVLSDTNKPREGTSMSFSITSFKELSQKVKNDLYLSACFAVLYTATNTSTYIQVSYICLYLLGMWIILISVDILFSHRFEDIAYWVAL